MAGLAILAGCAPTEPPNVLLIVSDALRADAIECSGGPASTPNLCALAARGVLFENAFANAPWTLPSTVAMMTGSYPSRFRREQEQPARLTSFYYVPEEQRLLAEEFRDRGLRVECLLENGLARRANALQGFTITEWDRDRSLEILERFGSRLALEHRDPRDLKILWLLDAFFDSRNEKFFLLHWIDDPHAEYRPPGGILPEALVEESRELPRPVSFYMGLGHRRHLETGRRKLRNHVRGFSGEEIAFLKKLYLLEVESVDARVGRILAALELSGQAGKTIVVFTSDHGEAFGEHGVFLHGDALYDELVRVPLILAGPGIAPSRRVNDPVSHVDLMPTLAELAGVPLRGARGRSLLKALTAGRLEPQPVYLESPGRLDIDGLVARNWKILASVENGEVELYDLKQDPGELRDLSRRRPDALRRMLGLLQKVRDGNELARKADAGTAADAATLARTNRETREEMEALGYLD